MTIMLKSVSVRSIAKDVLLLCKQQA